MKCKRLIGAIIIEVLGMLNGIILIEGTCAQAPQSPEIVFVSKRDGNLEIYVIDVEGENPRRLTFHSAHDTWSTWSNSRKD